MSEKAYALALGSQRARRLSQRQLALMCGALGLASACLNPAISDEPPISETVSVAEGYDAGVEAVEPASEAEPAPSSAPFTEPSETSRDERRTRGSRRR